MRLAVPTLLLLSVLDGGAGRRRSGQRRGRAGARRGRRRRPLELGPSQRRRIHGGPGSSDRRVGVARWNRDDRDRVGAAVAGARRRRTPADRRGRAAAVRGSGAPGVPRARGRGRAKCRHRTWIGAGVVEHGLRARAGGEDRAGLRGGGALLCARTAVAAAAAGGRAGATTRRSSGGTGGCWRPSRSWASESWWPRRCCWRTHHRSTWRSRSRPSARVPRPRWSATPPRSGHSFRSPPRRDRTSSTRSSAQVAAG